MQKVGLGIVLALEVVVSVVGVELLVHVKVLRLESAGAVRDRMSSPEADGAAECDCVHPYSTKKV